MDQPLSMQNIHKRNIHAPGHIPTRTASNHAAAVLRFRPRATEIGESGVTSLKWTDLERRLDSEMNIVIKQTKAMCVHINN